MPPIISFLSDFGLADPYVGTVKAVILSAAPEVRIVDITHGVRPQHVAQAVFLAEQSWRFFPEGTVHLVVVDPGVGTDRPALAVRTPTGYIVGPDNGLLSAALPPEIRGGSQQAAVQVSVPPGYTARLIESPRVVRDHVSATFHGRDIFGPAAAYLASGGELSEIGPLRATIAVLPRFLGAMSADRLRGEVIHVDHFGNLITTIHGDQLPGSARVVTAAGRRLPRVRTYGDAEGLIALVGSSGYLELALVGGSAAAALDLDIGAAVEVQLP